MAKTKQIFIFILRFLAMSAAVSAAIIMATSHENATVLNLSFEAKYDDSPANKYFVIANAIAGVYSLFVLFLNSESLLLRIVVALDVIITLLLTSSMSAALAIAYVGKKGNSHAGWLPICGEVPKFCDQLTGALVAGSIGLIIYVVLILHSVCTVLNPLV